MPREEATPPVTNTCLVGVAALHGLRSYPRGTGPSAPDAPNEPPGVRQRALEGDDRGHPAGERVDAVDAGDRGGSGVGAESAELAGATVRRVPATTTPVAWAARPSARPARIASAPSSSASVPSTSRTSGARRVDLSGLLHQAGAGHGVEDGPGLAVDVLPLGLLGRQGEAEQLADPVVRRRVRGDRVALLGQQLAAERVHQRLLAGVDQVVGQRVAGGDGAAGGGDGLGQRGDELLVGAGHRDQRDGPVGQSPAEDGRADGGQERVAVVAPRPGPRPARRPCPCWRPRRSGPRRRAVRRPGRCRRPAPGRRRRW